MDINFFIQNSYEISKLITKNYSTSFSLATSLLESEKRKAIYAIYGFVRLADEIVDSFAGHNQQYLLDDLKEDLYYTINNNIHTNPIIVSFVDTVKKFNIKREHIEAFIKSMESDLTIEKYETKIEIENYIYGSADVVGLMCLQVFCDGDDNLYDKLEYSARKLGSAFQKVNFLRDLNFDTQYLGRIYFPEISNGKFDNNTKKLIERSIENDFKEAYKGIKYLPGRSKLAVSIANSYYLKLFKKMRKLSYDAILSKRIRLSNFRKFIVIVQQYFRYLTFKKS